MENKQGKPTKTGKNGILVLVPKDVASEAAQVKELEAAGFEVHVCSDPKFAVNVVEMKPKNWKPNFFFVDISLPQISGFELVRRIIEKYSKLNVPVVMMSPHKSPEDNLEASNAGAIGLVLKPLTAKTVLNIIEKEKMKKLKAEASAMAFDISYE